MYVVDDLVDAHLCAQRRPRSLGRHAEARKHLKDIIDELLGGGRVSQACLRAGRLRPAADEKARLLRSLKLPPSFLEREIKGAYHAQSLLHHPDRHSTASPEVQQPRPRSSSGREALDILGDPQKRELYDLTRASTIGAIHAKLEAAKRASNNHSNLARGQRVCGGCG